MAVIRSKNAGYQINIDPSLYKPMNNIRLSSSVNTASINWTMLCPECYVTIESGNLTRHEEYHENLNFILNSLRERVQ